MTPEIATVRQSIAAFLNRAAINMAIFAGCFLLGCASMVVFIDLIGFDVPQ